MAASSYPHSQLLFDSASSWIVVSGHHIQIVDPSTGKLVASSTNFSSQDQEKLIKSGPIRCAAVTTSGTHLATISEDKMLKVWDLTDGSLKIASERELPKKPTCVAFTTDGLTILVSDKFGDVFSYTLHPSLEPETEKRTSEQPKDRTSLISHPSTSGTLVLGHTSLLTTFLLSHDEKYILTADRDEHIRVSWYPQGYCIESYCLGSTKFVSALHIPKSQPSLLISGGGDHEIRLWDWITGQLKYEISIWGTVQDRIQVKVPLLLKKNSDDNDGDDDQERPTVSKRRKSKVEQSTQDVQENDRDAHTTSASSLVEEEVILAVKKIDSLVQDGKLYIAFSVIGGTSVYLMECPSADMPEPSIQAYDVEKPVLDFTVVSGAVPSIWISADSSWPYVGGAISTDSVHVAEVSNGKIVTSAREEVKGVLSTFNTVCAIAGDAQSLDLYGALKAFPKNRHAEHNPMERDDGGGSEGGENARSRKEIGKMKSKKAILERQSKPRGDAET